GIGGLTAALSLQRLGFKVSLYERAPQLGEFGAGIVLTPNAMHALGFLGVCTSIMGSSNPSMEHEYRHYKTAAVLQHRRLDDAYCKYGAGILQVHRVDLQRVLSVAVLGNDATCIHVGHTLTDVSQDDRRVIARFANGTVVEADALIGCDGVRSTVRARLH